MKLKIGIINPMPRTSKIDFIIKRTNEITRFFLSFVVKISRVFFIKFFKTESQTKYFIYLDKLFIFLLFLEIDIYNYRILTK